MGYPARDIATGLTHERLCEVLHYDPACGEFWRLETVSGKVLVPPQKCGSRKADDQKADRYTYITVDGHLYFAHRLAWLYQFGEWPVAELDHINGNKRDNRICNLREVTSMQNNQNRALASNNTSGCKGVGWDRMLGAWRVIIYVNYRKIYVGCSRVWSEAIAMRKAAEQQYFGCYSRTPEIMGG